MKKYVFLLIGVLLLSSCPLGPQQPIRKYLVDEISITIDKSYFTVISKMSNVSNGSWSKGYMPFDLTICVADDAIAERINKIDDWIKVGYSKNFNIANVISAHRDIHYIENGSVYKNNNYQVFKFPVEYKNGEYFLSENIEGFSVSSGNLVLKENKKYCLILGNGAVNVILFKIFEGNILFVQSEKVY